VEDFRNSTFIPFFRRFKNERQRELEEAYQLYYSVKASQDAFTEDMRSFAQPIYDDYIGYLPEEIGEPLTRALYDILIMEYHIWNLPPPDFEKFSLQEFVEYRNFLYRKQYFFANKTEILRLLYESLVRTLYGVVRELPEVRAPSPFTIPLVYALPNPQLSVEQTYGTVVSRDYQDAGILMNVATRLHANLCTASGRDPNDPDSKKPYKLPTKSDLPLRELVDTYLADTPYHPVFMAPVALKLSHEDRFNHMHVIGGTGAGKTTLLENLIRHDINHSDPPSIVLIDPHGDLIRKLMRSDLGIEDRVILIDPRDTDHPPALNIFALNKERMGKYSSAMKEQVTAGVIQTFDYLFSGLLGAHLTAKQGVFFRYVARLLLAIPETMGRNATILDMLKLMSDVTPYERAIQALPEIHREFFIHDFQSKTFEQTKEQIRYRLQAIIENPTLARLFTSTESKVDFFTELNRGSVILVDTAKDFLKDGSSTFGRIFISLILQAVLERAALPEHERKPTFIFVDEAGAYFDTRIDDLLTEVRKYNTGLCLSHQFLDQATVSLRASLAANTGIKFASGLSAGDARAMASEMRTTPEFILNQPRLQFAAYIKNVTPQAVSIPIKRVTDYPRLSQDNYEDLLKRNRQRVSVPPEPRSFWPKAAKEVIEPLAEELERKIRENRPPSQPDLDNKPDINPSPEPKRESHWAKKRRKKREAKLRQQAEEARAQGKPQEPPLPKEDTTPDW
jgi:hypothetical protein